MARTLNLTGFQVGDSLSLSVSQGALTAGPVNVSSWGGPTGGGTVTINVERTTQQVAPDTVRFTVDLSAATFDTQGPGAGEVYDPRMHELYYFWDLKDTAPDYTKPTNVLSAWKDRSVAKGPFVQHVYSEPGSYSPSVTIYEPSSGKMATATVDTPIVVNALGDVFADADIYLLNPVGDSDFSDGLALYPGAQTENISNLKYDTAPFSGSLGGNPKAWLFKRGGVFDVHLRIGSSTASGVYFGAYGSDPAKPVLGWDGTISAELREMNLFSLESYGANELGVAPDIRWSGLNFVHTFDPAVLRADLPRQPQPVIRSLADCCGIVSDCDFSGWGRTNMNFQGSSSTNEQSWHIDDCSMTAFGGQYPIFGVGSTHARSSFAVTGCSFVQSVDAMSSIDTQGASRAILRSSNPHRYHMRCIDSYHTDYNQHHFVPFKDALEQGGIVNIHSCTMEGGNGGINLHADYVNGDTIDPGNSIALNAIIDGVFYFSNYSSQTPFYSNASGVTWRNLHCVHPSVSRVGGNQFGMVNMWARGTFDATMVGNAPVKVYNCTYIYLKTDAQNVGTVQDPTVLVYTQGGADPFNVVVEENNIIHKPNAGPTATQVTTFAPLTTATLFPFRSIGYFATDPSLATRGTSGDPLASDWLDGQTKTFAYGDAYNYPSGDLPIDSSNFAGSNGKEYLISGGNYYYAEDGDLTVTYGASEISVTNNSGVTFPRTDVWLLLDMGSTAPIAPDTVPPAGSWGDYKPDTGSVALGGATTGNIAYDGIGSYGVQRPSGSEDDGSWQVST